MINSNYQDAQTRMTKSLDSLKADLAKIRTGRAHPSILEHISIDYYGVDTPLSQVANISLPDARTLMIMPWEKNMVPVIEKAIMVSDLGLNPATSSDGIRVPMPPLNEERRRELIKVVKTEGENAKIAVRNIRRDANNQLKELLKAKDITEDDERGAQDKIQKLTDKFTTEVDAALQAKEADLMEI